MKIKAIMKVHAVSLRGLDAKNTEARINEASAALAKDGFDVIEIIVKRTCAIFVYRSKHLETEQLKKKEVATIEVQPQALNYKFNSVDEKTRANEMQTRAVTEL